MNLRYTDLMLTNQGWDKVKQALIIENKLGMEHLTGKELKRVFWAVVNADNLDEIEGLI